MLAFSAFLRVGEITKSRKLNQHFLLIQHINITASPKKENSIELATPHCKHSIRPTSLRISWNLENALLSQIRTLQHYADKKTYFTKRSLFFFHGWKPSFPPIFYNRSRKSTKFPCLLRIRLKAIPISQFSNRGSHCCSNWQMEINMQLLRNTKGSKF